MLLLLLRVTVDCRSETLEVTNKFSDSVSPTPWHSVSFSSNGNYVLGCPADRTMHTISVWDHENNALAEKMHGPKEHVRDVQWHPIRLGSGGGCVIWQRGAKGSSLSCTAQRFKEVESKACTHILTFAFALRATDQCL